MIEDAHKMAIQENDTIVLKKSLRDDMPIVFGAITAALSLVTLVFVVKNQKK